jgi:hypothetical protein
MSVKLVKFDGVFKGRCDCSDPPQAERITSVLRPLAPFFHRPVVFHATQPGNAHTTREMHPISARRRILSISMLTACPTIILA